MEKEIAGIQNQEIMMSILILLYSSCFLGQTAKPVDFSPTGFGFALNRSRKDNRIFLCQNAARRQKPESQTR
jgi:hypothetical protein